VLNCSSFCAEPYDAKGTVMDFISCDDVRVTAMHPGQRCTIVRRGARDARTVEPVPRVCLHPLHMEEVEE